MQACTVLLLLVCCARRFADGGLGGAEEEVGLDEGRSTPPTLHASLGSRSAESSLQALLHR